MNVDDAADSVQDDSIPEKASSEDYTSRKMKEKNSSHQAAVDTPYVSDLSLAAFSKWLSC